MKTVTITLSEPEVQALLSLMDAGVRHEGIKSATNAAVLMDKIQKAMNPPQESSNGED